MPLGLSFPICEVGIFLGHKSALGVMRTLAGKMGAGPTHYLPLLPTQRTSPCPTPGHHFQS